MQGNPVRQILQQVCAFRLRGKDPDDGSCKSVSKMLSVQDVRNDDGTWSKRKFQIIDSLKGGSDPRDIMVTDQIFQLKLRRICKDLGIECRSPHKGRKTYISNLLNKGLDPDFVREQVGHKDLQTAYNSYTFSTTRKEKQLKQLEKALSV